MEILEAMVKNKNTEEEIEQWTESHSAAVAIYDAPNEEFDNRIVKLKREKEEKRKNIVYRMIVNFLKRSFLS